jgi:hypothetical protein
MSKGANAGLLFKFYYDEENTGELVANWLSKNSDSNAEIKVSTHKIPGLSSDLSIGINDPDTIVLTAFFDSSGIDVNALTIKKNGSSNAINVKPVHVDSKKITSLTVSNSSASDLYLVILRILTTGNNVVLI